MSRERGSLLAPNGDKGVDALGAEDGRKLSTEGFKITTRLCRAIFLPFFLFLFV